jgi:uncharacterized protein YaiL (DUF2058 family)
MTDSLAEQLLKAGLVTKKQAQQAERQTGKQQFQKTRGRKKGSQGNSARVVPAAQAAKAARDRELNREQQARVEIKAREARLQQLVEQHRLPALESDDFFNFVDEGKVRRLPVDGSRRERMVRGDLRIVRLGQRYEVVPAALADRIRDISEGALIEPGLSGSAEANVDENYRHFEVPDDLIW